MANGRLSKDFTQGSVARQLLLFTLPFMASNALLVLYSTIDMIIVGAFVGTAGLSAVSQSSQIVNFATMVCLGFSNAGQVLLSQALGAGKRREANDIIGTVFVSVGVLAAVLAAVLVIGSCAATANRTIWRANTSSSAPPACSSPRGITSCRPCCAVWATPNAPCSSSVSPRAST